MLHVKKTLALILGREGDQTVVANLAANEFIAHLVALQPSGGASVRRPSWLGDASHLEPLHNMISCAQKG